MKTQLHLTGVVLWTTLALGPARSPAQGSLTPPGPPGPTMKTLSQIEARTPISSAPYTITDSGSYYLTTNLTVSGGDAITIAANNVTLDLNGFTISSTAPSATGVAILLSGNRTNVAIYNGHIQSGVTNDNAGVFGGPGFGYGIFGSGTAPSNVRVRDVSVRGVLYHGIDLRPYNNTVVESCTVDVAGSSGIVAGTVSGSVARNCGTYGIFALTANDCVGVAVGSGSGLYARTANNCYGQSSSGMGLYADTANNCYGNSQSGYGLYAYYIATGCAGLSTTGLGLSTYAANNSYGYSINGTGLSGIAALNCYGYSINGTGLSGTTALNCYGFSTGGPAGILVQSAAFCVGNCSGGRAIWATIANGCWAAGGTNFITYKYNMP